MLQEMPMLKEMWVDRTDYHHTKVLDADLPTPGEGEILVAIDKGPMGQGDCVGYWGGDREPG